MELRIKPFDDFMAEPFLVEGVLGGVKKLKLPSSLGPRNEGVD